MSATGLQLQRRGGGAFEMNLMQRLENSSRPNQAKKNNKRKAQNPPRNPPAPKRQKNNNGLSTARPQKAAAAAYSSGQHTGEARVYRTGNDTCRIVHRELLSSITGSVAFTIPQTIALNPGLSSSFPWLSTQAQAWERYRFNKLRFCYFTRTGSNVPGSLMMAPDYDAADSAPVSESIASSYEDCEEDAPWKDIKCILPSRSLMGDMKEKYIRSGALQANQDIKTYDAGNLFVCTVDGTAVGWGKLWVEYDVTLFHPQVPSGGFQASGTLQGVTGMSAAAPFGTQASQVQTGPILLSALTAALADITISNVQVGQEIVLTSVIQGTVITGIFFQAENGLTVKTATASNTIDAGGNNGTAQKTYIVTAVPAKATLSVTATTVTRSLTVASVLAPVPAF